MGAIKIKKNKPVTEVEQKSNLSVQPAVTGVDVDNSPKSDAEFLNNQLPKGEPIENYTEDSESNVIEGMNVLANRCKYNAQIDGHKIMLRPVASFRIKGQEIKWFSIKSVNADKEYAIYELYAKIYYRPIKEFKQILKDYKDGVNKKPLTALANDYANVQKPLDSVSVINRNDCYFIIYAIFSALTGKSYSKTLLDHYNMAESCMIRKHNKLGSDGLVKDSKKADEIKYGTEEENNFKQEVEDKQKQDGTVGALDQQQLQESNEPQFKPSLPNVHRVNENWVNLTELMEADLDNIIYEPGDKIIAKIVDDTRADEPFEDNGEVINVIDNIEYGQLITVLCHGKTYAVAARDIKPDFEHYMSAKPNDVLVRGELEINRKTRLTDKVENDKTDYSKEYKDLNDYRVECDIVVNGMKCNFEKYYAQLRDISESKKVLHVINESGKVMEIPVDNIIVSEDEWPYAVVVDADAESDEPLRKIRINPTSYIEAEDDELVDCLVAGENTQMVKKNIKIIS